MLNITNPEILLLLIMYVSLLLLLSFLWIFFGPRVTGAVGYAYVRLHCKKNVVEMIDGGRHSRSFLGWILKHKKSILRKGLHRYKNEVIFKLFEFLCQNSTIQNILAILLIFQYSNLIEIQCSRFVQSPDKLLWKEKRPATFFLFLLS